jgi:hypothetical protein
MSNTLSKLAFGLGIAYIELLSMSYDLKLNTHYTKESLSTSLNCELLAHFKWDFTRSFLKSWLILKTQTQFFLESPTFAYADLSLIQLFFVFDYQLHVAKSGLSILATCSWYRINTLAPNWLFFFLQISCIHPELNNLTSSYLNAFFWFQIFQDCSCKCAFYTCDFSNSTKNSTKWN